MPVTYFKHKNAKSEELNFNLLVRVSQ